MNHKLLKYSLLFIVGFFINCVYSQQYNFKTFTPQNGLAGSIVNNIFQDSKGYLWFATQGGGVSRFNGKEFKNFTKNNGLIANDITCIAEDRVGNIWIGTTTEGVSKFDGLKFTNYTDKEGLANNAIYSIYCDEKNNVWFGTDGGGISIFDGKKFKNLSIHDGLACDMVYAITQDKKGDFWFALKCGVAKFDGARITNYEKEKVILNKRFFSILCDRDGDIWFGSSNAGVVKYNGEKFEEFKIPEEVSSDFIGGITQDLYGNVWFATEHGALKFDGGNFTLFNEKNGLPSNIVLSTYTDYEGNVWFGIQQSGVTLLSNETFVKYDKKDGLVSNKITSQFQTGNNSFIIGTYGNGIMSFSNNEFVQIRSIPELSQSIISAISADNENNYWIGTDAGLFILKRQDNDIFVLHKHIKALNNVPLPIIVNIVQDKNGAMWVATYGAGVFKIDKDNIEHFSVESGLPTSNILVMFKDSSDGIWLGTNDAGVLKKEKHNFKNYSTGDGLASKSVWTITEDDNHNIYFGTNDAGISCFDGKEFTHISSRDGVCSNNITTLVWDKRSKHLFVGTDKGINKLKFSSKFKIDSIYFYGEQEGFKGGEVNSSAVLIDDAGIIWFGTPEGLYRYNRKYDYVNLIPPKLILKEVRLFYQQIDWKNYSDSVNARTNIPHNLTLSYENNHLTFYFQALTTSDVKYSYILEGLDKEWSPLSAIPEANFTNITPGKSYTFKVKAVNNNGVWSADEIAFSFTINPPWWQTWWFYSIAFVLIVSGVLGFINYRTAKLAKEKKVLEEKVIERTHELKQANVRLSEAIHAITDSMNYAQRIQQSFLTSEKVLDQILGDYFILYKPRDIVSGDFYWSFDLPDRTIIACADCTGHGIPGAFMSLIGLSLLNEISHSKGIVEPAKMLDELRRIIIMGLNPEQNETGGKDGMDITLISIFKSQEGENVKVHFSGANSVLCLVTQRNKQPELLEFKGDKQPVGYYSIMKPFTQQEIIAKRGDMLYMFTDGYADQFGGENGKKFMAKQLKRNLLNLVEIPTSEQKQRLNSSFIQWQGDLEQVDDVTVVGIKIV